MSISEKITQYRKMRGLTQETLGEALGITAQAISKWEVGSTMPDIFLLPRLCELLDVPPDVLLEIPQDLSVRYLRQSRTKRKFSLIKRLAFQKSYSSLAFSAFKRRKSGRHGSAPVGYNQIGEREHHVHLRLLLFKPSVSRLSIPQLLLHKAEDMLHLAPYR